MFPYFETLLDHLRCGDTAAQQAFGQHVHWGYWDNPLTVPHSPEEFHRAAEAMLERMVRQSAIRNGMALLDVGCGLGGTINFLNNRYHDCTFSGINIDRNQLHMAKQLATSGNHNALHFIQGDACALPFCSDCFEVILCVESIFHFADRRRFFLECERILKPGGMLVISDFVPIACLGKLLHSAQQSTHIIDKMYGKIHTDISKSQYRLLSRNSGMQCTSIEDVTPNTLPTYRFLKSHLQRTEKRNAYHRATFLVELVSRMRLVRYLILAFRKPGRP
jgi:ubiquinone/menaquinone biosynthesis C-methylase UbiE